MVHSFVRTIGTDFESGFDCKESVPKCHGFYMQFSRCQEAYGANRARHKCADEMADLHECIYGHKQRLRAKLINEERERKHKAGLLPQKYVDPTMGTISQSHQ